MSFLQEFYSAHDAQTISINAEQGSRFAKEVAGDFNPIHDPESKRFCVPGDLLFAISLHRLGLQQWMSFKFTGLVSGDKPLVFPPALSPKMQVNDDRGKSLLDIESGGEKTHDQALIESFVRKYVSFSGQNFPHILMPLMKQNNVMVNPQRPLVIYESMSFKFDSFELEELSLDLNGTTLDIDGKRGTAALNFILTSAGKHVGSGLKTLVLSGLREYQDDVMNELYNNYVASKDAYLQAE